MKNNTSLIYSFLLVVGDFLALAAAFGGAYILRVSLDHRPIVTPIPSRTYLAIFLSVLPFWILIFAMLGLYNARLQEKRFVEAGRLLIGSFIGLLFVITYAYFDNRPIFPARLVPIYGFALSFAFLLIFRNLIRAIRGLMYKLGKGVTNILLVGKTAVTRELTASLANPSTGYRVIGIVDGVSRKGDIPHWKNFSDAIADLEPSEIHGVVQTELFADALKNNEILEYCQTHHVAFRFVPGNTELFVGRIDVELFQASIPVVAVHQTALIGWGRIVKRVTDITLGGLALLVATPFMIVCALAIKISNPRAPILFRDKRLTRFGGTTQIYKFRTHKRTFTGMTPEQAFKKMGRPELIEAYRTNGDQLPNDPRVTRIGRFLRRTSMDELPQLINVVRGDISLVGPRALQGHELENFDRKNLILAVKSGLTGLAQVSGRRGISFEERRQLDIYYVQNWSLWLDLTILAKTARAVISRGGVV